MTCMAAPVGSVGVAHDDLRHRLARIGWRCIEYQGRRATAIRELRTSRPRNARLMLRANGQHKHRVDLRDMAVQRQIAVRTATDHQFGPVATNRPIGGLISSLSIASPTLPVAGSAAKKQPGKAGLFPVLR